MNAALSHFIDKEKKKILDAFYSDVNYRTRASTKIVKRLIINAPYLINGRMYDIKVKSLGAGIYELSLKDFT